MAKARDKPEDALQYFEQLVENSDSNLAMAHRAKLLLQCKRDHEAADEFSRLHDAVRNASTPAEEFLKHFSRHYLSALQSNWAQAMYEADQARAVDFNAPNGLKFEPNAPDPLDEEFDEWARRNPEGSIE